MPIDNKQLRSGNLNGTYRDFAEVLGMEVTLRIYQHYKGLKVTFPTRLLDKAFVEEQIRKEYNGTNAKDLVGNTSILNAGSGKIQTPSNEGIRS